MKILIACLSILLFSCSEPPMCISAFPAGGMNFCIQYDTSTEPINTNIIEDLVSITEFSASEYYPTIVGVRDMLDRHDVTVVVTKLNLVQYCHDAPFNDTYVCEKDISGINSNSDFIMIEDPMIKNCFFFSALMHEILHTIDDVYLGGSNHDTPYMFKQNYPTVEEQRNTIERNAIVRMMEKKDEYPEECPFPK